MRERRLLGAESVRVLAGLPLLHSIQVSRVSGDRDHTSPKCCKNTSLCSSDAISMSCWEWVFQWFFSSATREGKNMAYYVANSAMNIILERHAPNKMQKWHQKGIDSNFTAALWCIKIVKANVPFEQHQSQSINFLSLPDTSCFKVLANDFGITLKQHLTSLFPHPALPAR